jgi:very-short-patch-repair endonuclease
MDFLLLMRNQRRLVIEIDGKQHYTDGDRASPPRYAEMMIEDRELRMAGYEVFRFGGYEFRVPRTPVRCCATSSHASSASTGISADLHA